MSTLKYFMYAIRHLPKHEPRSHSSDFSGLQKGDTTNTQGE